VLGDTVLREYMEDEKAGEICGGNGIMCGDKNGLLREAVDDNQDSVICGGRRQFLNEVHRDRIPRAVRDRKLFKSSIRAVALRLGAHAGSTGFTEVLDESAEIRPSVFAADQFQSLVLPEMAC
jgi:hypothetical protein